MRSLDVKVWSVRKRNTKKSSYDVRWTVARNVFSEQFRTKGLRTTIDPSCFAPLTLARSSTPKPGCPTR